ncbi:hypothetical protein NQ317_011911 [Molorchus minor]|uniref:DDE Tnp4 domain-containing protein n=1 Tax=Molorchus minor TaxID=1323400 RepID=A0ABQ9JK96_9CUCU|nr:hypothetical protein NQ317_011911 [Molorchus minor]
MASKVTGGIFSVSNIYKRLQTSTFNMPKDEVLPQTDVYAPYVLVGDEAYPLKRYLLKPYPRQNLTDEQRIFNYRLSRARRCVECAFGILVAKWRCLKTELQVNREHVDIIVQCVCLLHNIVIDKEGYTGNIHDITPEKEVSFLILGNLAIKMSKRR